jgi:GT2 family glycosyltransferase
MTKAHTTIVTVSHNSAGVLGRMLSSIPKGVPVIIVDNASTDISKTRELAAQHGAILIENSENLGFGTACNCGADAATSEFLLFLNPDAALEQDTLEALHATADSTPDAVAINPVLMGPDGNPAIKRKSDLIPKSEYVTGNAPDKDMEIYTLNGAALMVRADAFHSIGGFDPNIFLFFEDDDLAARLRPLGRLMVSHAAYVHHIGGSASSGPKLAGEAFKAWHTGFSRLYVLRKHRMPFASARALGRALVRALSPTLLFSPMHRARRLSYLRGTWRAVRSKN